jgi:hypothetical protein
MPVRLGLSVHNATAIRMEHLTGYVGGIVRSENTKQVATSSGSPARPSGVSEPNVAASPVLVRSNFLFLRHSKAIFAARECLSRAYLRKRTATTKKSRKSGKILLTPV